jgi:hypothetical protein
MAPGLLVAGGASSPSGGDICDTTGLPVTGCADGPCADSGSDGRAGRLITQPEASASAIPVNDTTLLNEAEHIIVSEIRQVSDTFSPPP